MLLVAFALAIVLLIALAINADIGQLLGLTQAQTASAIPLVVILMLVASALVHRRHRLRDIAGGFAIWALIGAILFAGYTFRDDLSRVGLRLVGALQPGTAIIDPNTGNVHVSRSIGGSFFIETSVNGADMPMIFDTGASAVVLSAQDARRAGIDTEMLRYSVPVQTANGVGSAAAVTLDEVRVGNIIRHNVRAFVVEESALEASLLGMTFLETLSRYTVSRDSLELHD